MQDTASMVIQQSNGQRTKSDGPETVVLWDQANGLAREGLAHVDGVPSPLDLSVGPHPSHRHLGLVLWRADSIRVAPQRKPVVTVTCPPRTGPGVMLVLGLKERGVKMARRKHTAEQIINKLREAEVAISAGSTVAEVSRQIGVTQQTFYRWRTEYGGLKIDQARRLKQLETENGRLRRAVADLTFDRRQLLLPVCVYYSCRLTSC